MTTTSRLPRLAAAAPWLRRLRADDGMTDGELHEASEVLGAAHRELADLEADRDRMPVGSARRYALDDAIEVANEQLCDGFRRLEARYRVRCAAIERADAERMQDYTAQMQDLAAQQDALQARLDTETRALATAREELLIVLGRLQEHDTPRAREWAARIREELGR